jgi:hypothetical protein
MTSCCRLSKLSGEILLDGNPKVEQIQRGIVPLATAHGPRYLMGVWQASPRSNEQIWRALSGMPQPTLFNILIQPSILYAAEKHALLEIKKSVSNSEQNEANSARLPWVENYMKRRLAVWKRFFLIQVHLVTITNGNLDNLIRSVGSALTRDSNELALPGYQTRPRNRDSEIESRQWLENIRSLDLTESPLRLDDLADQDEVFSIFRFPYRQDAGLPGANFIEKNIESDPM